MRHRTIEMIRDHILTYDHISFLSCGAKAFIVGYKYFEKDKEEYGGSVTKKCCHCQCLNLFTIPGVEGSK